MDHPSAVRVFVDEVLEEIPDGTLLVRVGPVQMFLKQAPIENADQQEQIKQLTERAKRAEEQVARFSAVYLDKPEDRLWHASDQTWWRRDDAKFKGALVAASPPAIVTELWGHLCKAKDEVAKISIRHAQVKDALTCIKSYLGFGDDKTIYQEVRQRIEELLKNSSKTTTEAMQQHLFSGSLFNFQLWLNRT